MGPRCSFCGASTGPFLEVEGLFTVLMCVGCQAARSSSPPRAANHPGRDGWTATFHAEQMRVVYRRAAGQGSGEG